MHINITKPDAWMLMGHKLYSSYFRVDLDLLLTEKDGYTLSTRVGMYCGTKGLALPPHLQSLGMDPMISVMEHDTSAQPSRKNSVETSVSET